MLSWIIRLTNIKLNGSGASKASSQTLPPKPSQKLATHNTEIFERSVIGCNIRFRYYPLSCPPYQQMYVYVKTYFSYNLKAEKKKGKTINKTEATPNIT